MKRAARFFLTFALAACIVSPLAAGEEKTEKKAKKKGQARRTVQVLRVPKTVELTDEQKTQVAAINKEFAPKLMEVQKKLRGILTDEQRKAQAAANKSIRESKLKGKERAKALDEALSLTDEQKKQMADVRAEMSAVRKAANEKFFAILTPEQQKQAKPPRKAKPAKKKAKAAKTE